MTSGHSDPPDLQRPLRGFRGTPLPEAPAIADLDGAVADYEAICCANIRAVVERFERHGGGYPFVDTKLDLRTGADFPADDVVRGRDTVYGWIQGRGLEALAGHALWADRHASAELQALAPRLREMAAAVLDSVRRLRERNEGHLLFFMEPDGAPFVIGAAGDREPVSVTAATPSGYSDLFGAKGLYAGARLLGDAAAEVEAIDWMARVSADIWSGAFASDQQPLDPTNPIETTPGRHPHGPYMIHLGACALGAAADRAEAIDEGLRLIAHELGTHANLGRRLPDLHEGDFWEFVGDDGLPQRDADGSLLCDPGHALEFVGLALKFAAAAQPHATPAQRQALADVLPSLFTVLRQVFRFGFQAGPGGICKAYDLVGRQPLHTDMPWWNLPETIRSAALCWQADGDAAHQRECLRIWAACHNAFVEHYLRPDVHLMAVQTRAADGSVSPAIPATADADPGYHTGLSLLDVIALMRGA